MQKREREYVICKRRREIVGYVKGRENFCDMQVGGERICDMQEREREFDMQEGEREQEGERDFVICKSGREIL